LIILATYQINIIEDHKSKYMKTILVPTDFSENAFIAGQYAASLAKELNAKVLFYHVYIVLYSGFEETGVSVKHVEWAEREASEAMANLLQSFEKEFPDVEIDGEHVRGFMIDALSERLKADSSIELIVMGSKGVTNVADAIFGSTTYEVIKKSPIPVLVIPQDTGDYSLKHIGFFSDYQLHEIDSLKRVRELFKNVQSFNVVHFVKLDAGSNADSKQAWKLKASAAINYEDLNMIEIEVKKADLNAVSKAASTQQLDLMVFTRPQKSFFEKVFGSSLTKQVANYPIIPSLYINE
jgi:nucleotide-binding universal stress UspA family protein